MGHTLAEMDRQLEGLATRDVAGLASGGRKGMAVPLALLPGMNCSPGLWDDVLDGLQPSGTVIHGRLDQPGIDRAVAALISELPERFDVVGLSLGGIVAMALIRVAPERVRRLALLPTNADLPRRPNRRAGPPR